MDEIPAVLHASGKAGNHSALPGTESITRFLLGKANTYAIYQPFFKAPAAQEIFLQTPISASIIQKIIEWFGLKRSTMIT